MSKDNYIFANIELNESLDVIKAGLSILQNYTINQTKIVTVFVLLAHGFERILKIVYSLHILEQENRIIENKDLRKFGHDLTRLHKALLEECFTDKIREVPIVNSDFKQIKTDSILDKLFSVLTDFMKSGRYLYIDGINKPSKVASFHINKWEELESVATPHLNFIEFYEQNGANNDATQRYKDLAHKHIIISIEKYLRAIYRSLGNWKITNEKVKNCSNEFHEFNLMESQLGQKNYTVW
ncbi:MAG: hypothetical protein WD607_05200 [Candidatus Paceibacterota bacterium]